MLDRVSLTSLAFSSINTWIFPLIITMETPGTISFPMGIVTVQWTFPQSWFNFVLFFSFRSSLHGVSISWRQRFPRRYFYHSLKLLHCVRLRHFTMPAESFTLSTVSLTTGRDHIQLLGDSSFKFSPWTPGEFFTLALNSACTALHCWN